MILCFSINSDLLYLYCISFINHGCCYRFIVFNLLSCPTRSLLGDKGFPLDESCQVKHAYGKPGRWPYMGAVYWAWPYVNFEREKSRHIVATTKGKIVSFYPTSNTVAAVISRSSGCPFSSLFFLQNLHINNRSCYCPEYAHIKLNRKHLATVTIQIHKPLLQ